MDIELKDIQQQIDFATHYLISSCKKLQDKYPCFKNIKIEDFDKLPSPDKEYLEIFKGFITYRFFFNNIEYYSIVFLPADMSNSSRYYYTLSTGEPSIKGCKFYCYEAKYKNCVCPIEEEYRTLIYECFKECSKLRAEQAAKLDEILKDTSNTNQDNLLSFMRFLDTMQWDSLIR